MAKSMAKNIYAWIRELLKNKINKNICEYAIYS